MICSWGPILLGTIIRKSIKRCKKQLDLGDCLNGPSESMVQLAELLVEIVPHARWAQFQKNGTDVTITAVTIARAGTLVKGWAHLGR